MNVHYENIIRFPITSLNPLCIFKLFCQFGSNLNDKKKTINTRGILNCDGKINHKRLAFIIESFNIEKVLIG